MMGCQNLLDLKINRFISVKPKQRLVFCLSVSSLKECERAYLLAKLQKCSYNASAAFNIQPSICQTYSTSSKKLKRNDKRSSITTKRVQTQLISKHHKCSEWVTISVFGRHCRIRLSQLKFGIIDLTGLNKFRSA